MTSKDRWGAGSLRQVQINWNRRMDRGRTIKDKEEGGGGEERAEEKFGPSGYLRSFASEFANVHGTATLPSATCVRDRIGVNYSDGRRLEKDRLKVS